MREHEKQFVGQYESDVLRELMGKMPDAHVTTVFGAWQLRWHGIIYTVNYNGFGIVTKCVIDD